MHEIKNCIIVATAEDLQGNKSTVYTVVVDEKLRFLRYVPYRGALIENGLQPVRYAKDEATRLTITEARKLINTENERRGDQPEKHSWAREVRIIENP